MLGVVVIVLASATIIEQAAGREFALKYIYHSVWFAALWGALAVCSAVYIYKQKLYRNYAACALHAAFVVILIGALITSITAERGTLHLRQGKPQRHYTKEDEVSRQSLPFEVKLVLFEVQYDTLTGKPKDYISFLRINDTLCKVSMNKIHRRNGYRLYQLSYDSDEMGTHLLVYRDQWGIAVTYAGYMLLALAMLWLMWLRIGRKRFAAVMAACAAVWVMISQITPMTPILRTPMLALHVSVIMVSYAMLLYMALSAAVALAHKRKSSSIYSINQILLYPAVFLLAAGIFIGAVWANISWGRYWGWDAKETWALITLLIYAIPLHKRSIPALGRERFFHKYCLIAFFAVIMTFAGVSFLLAGGMHSYV